jgi:CRISPR-associated protein Cas2
MRTVVILFLKRTTPGLRGELSRWMIEPQAGVFVGNISALVRDKLWDYVREEAPEASAMMLHSAQTEQGFTIRCAGDDARRPRDFDGLTLMEYTREPTAEG